MLPGVSHLAMGCPDRSATGFVVKRGDAGQIRVSIIVTLQYRGKVTFKILYLDPVLGSGRTGNRGLDRRKVEFENFSVIRFLLPGIK
jgi:hypothetical protein